MKRLLTILLLFCLSGLLHGPPAQAQTPLSADQIGKLDGEFQVLMHVNTSSKAQGLDVPAALPVLSATAIRSDRIGGAARFPVIIHTDDPSALPAAGISVNSTLGSISTARLTLDEIRDVARIGAVRFVEASPVSTAMNDEAAREVGARTLNAGAINNTNYDGSGVLTCIVDSGIDVTHGDFQDSSGNTRIVYLWDQTSTTSGQTPADRSSSFSGLNYGTESSSADIDGGSVSQQDTDGHGTHVAGTVASSGNALVLSGSQTTPEHRGMAPEADVIVVKAGNASFPNSNVIDAMTYCGTVADNQGQPLVINMSLGGNAGPHDGTSSLDLAVDAFTDGTPSNGTSDPGTAADRVVVVSAGNNGGSVQHVFGTIAVGGSATAPVTISSYSPTSGVVNDYVATQKWFDTAGDVTVTVRAPNGSDTATLAASGTSAQTKVVETQSGAIYLESGVSSENGDRYFDVQIYDWEDTSVSPIQEITPEDGTWQIEIQNNGSATTSYHGWNWGATIPGQYDNGDDRFTIGSPGSAAGAITVASHVHRWYWGTPAGAYAYNASISNRDEISTFSSPGPLRDGTVKPDISAPGQGMISAYSQDMGSVSGSRVFDADGVHRMTQGTSMSAPVVAGSVALLLQAATGEGQSLTANEVKQLLTDNAISDVFVASQGPVPNVRFGYGKLDILGSVVELLNGTSDSERLIYHENVGFSLTDTLTIGSGYADKVALRFTPSIDGVLTGALLTLDADFRSEGGTALNTTGDLEVEIWSDDGSGAPGMSLAPTILVPNEDLNQLTPNGIDLLSSAVQVVAGNDYHLVLSPENSTETIALFAETISPNGRTQILNGSTWSAAPEDLMARVDVAVANGISTVLPVELALFDALPSEDQVRLLWATTGESDNLGFYVERRIGDEGAWRSLGFVEGGGTTTDRRDYQFTDRGMPFTAEPLSYRLRQVDKDGTATYSDEKTVRLSVPDVLSLDPPSPNPVRTSTRIRYTLPTTTEVSIALYDVLGRRVATLQDGVQQRGPKQIEFNPSRLASGVYFLRLETDADILTERLTVVR
jgi:subtilisin family serine protease